VRDESVPAGGAELECPSCKALFVAYPPKKTVVETTMERALPNFDPADRARDIESTLATMTAAREELMRRLRDKDVELARATARADAADQSVARLKDELMRAQRAAGDSAELLSTKQHLLDAQRQERTIRADLDVANTIITSLKAEVKVLRGTAAPAQVQAAESVEQLQREIGRLREQLTAQAGASSSSGQSLGLRSLVGAVAPMLWGLEQSISYLEQFAANEATLAGHVKQMHLLHKVLKRLADEVG